MTYLNVTSLRVGLCRHPEVMTIKDGSFAPADFHALPMLLIHPTEGPILFDTGYDQAFLDATNKLPEKLYRWLTPVSFSEKQSLPNQLSRLNIDCSDVRHVILSHFHGDHMAGLNHFPNAQIHCAKAGFKLINKASRITGTRQGFLPKIIPDDFLSRSEFFEDKETLSLPKEFVPFEDAIDILGDGSILAIDLPGHCPGHWGIATKDNNYGWHFMVADAAWSLDAITRNVPPPKLATAFLGNTKQARQTLNQLYMLNQRNPDLRLTPYHCPKRAREAEKEIVI